MYTLRIIVFFFLLLPVLLFAQRADSLTIQDFRRMGLPFYDGNEVSLLSTGIVKFEDMFQAIKEARRYVHLDYFKFQNDSICDVLFDLLRQKAQEGVEIRIVYDGLGNKYSAMPLPKDCLDTLKSAGIQVCEFDPVKFPWVNHLFHRNHHKITVIDGEKAYTGGMNVADYYLHGKPEIGEWRDMHIRLEGPIVDGYQSVFADMWHKISGEKLDSLRYRGESVSNKNVLVALANRVPRQTSSIMRDTYCASIDNAQKLIQIVNPYATLVRSVRRSLYAALKRGVKVQFMVSTKGDSPILSNVIGIEMKKLMKRGAEVCYYNGGFHHSKVMMVDSIFCTVGTTNLDARSLRFDYEVNAFIFDHDITRELQEIFSHDVKQNCTILTPEGWKKQFPLRRRIAGRIIGVAKGAL